MAVLTAEKRTGHVYDVMLSLVTNDEQQVYKIFDNVEDARIYIDQFLKTDDQFEFVIYDKNQKPISFNR